MIFSETCYRAGQGPLGRQTGPRYNFESPADVVVARSDDV